ncbi:hypothetical protein CKQ90_34345, partial [Klebsiella pneumoniae]
RVLCVADNEQDALIQLAAVLAVGCEVLWPDSALQRDLAKKLPREVSERVLCVADNEQDALIQLAAVLAVGCEVLWPDSA